MEIGAKRDAFGACVQENSPEKSLLLGQMTQPLKIPRAWAGALFDFDSDQIPRGILDNVVHLLLAVGPSGRCCGWLKRRDAVPPTGIGAYQSVPSMPAEANSRVQDELPRAVKYRPNP